jgi:hypothetical protein
MKGKEIVPETSVIINQMTLLIGREDIVSQTFQT